MVNHRIETLRGMACILLVLYHVIGADPGRGLHVTDGWVRWGNDGLAYLRMPLFTFLSGLVYGMRPFAGDSKAFLMGKVRRLLIPMAVVGTVFAMMQAITPGTNAPVGAWYLLHVKPVGHFWFLESLFWIFLLVWAFERWQLMRGATGFVLVLASACVLYLSVRGWIWFGIEGAIYLFPYFLLGLAFSRFPLHDLLHSVWFRLALLALAGFAIWQIGVPVPNPNRRTPAMLLVGMSLCMLSLSYVVVSKGLSSVGRHSYPIYLFHVFFTAATRIVLFRLHIDALWIHVVLGLTLGLAGPVAIDLLASRYRWPALLLLGKSVRKLRAPGLQTAVAAAPK